jgi:cell wall-associated NlpC family hydrolase
MVDALGRVSQIQSTLVQLADLAPRTKDGSSPAPAGSDFGRALAGAVRSTTAVAASWGSGTSAAGSVTGDQVAAAAQKYVGVPYLWGGTDPSKGLDCSGFVQRVYQDLGISLPRVVHDQMQAGTPVASLADAKPGDLLVSFGGEHVAIYLGNGKAIDAPVPGQTIQVRDAWEKYANLTAIRRIVPDSPASSSPAGLDATQTRYAQTIVDRVRARGLPSEAAVDAVSTALQESSLRMYWNPKVAGSRALAPDQSAVGTDGYSVGLFQQQVSGNAFSWGTVADAMDPVKSTDMFLDRLTALPGWQSLSVAAADQAVQRSAYPEAYAKWEGQARQIVSALSGAGA